MMMLIVLHDNNHTNAKCKRIKGLKKVDDVILIVTSDEDFFLLTYAEKLIYNNETRIVIIDYNGKIKQNTAFKESIRVMEQTAPPK